MRRIFLCCGFMLSATVAGAQESDSERPRRGGTLRTLVSQPIGSLDPAAVRSPDEISVARNLFEGLLRLGDDAAVLPCLARDLPEVSSDGLTYTFTLRDDAFFQVSPHFTDGKAPRVTAEDVKYSWERLADTAIGFHGYLFADRIAGFSELTSLVTARRLSWVREGRPEHEFDHAREGLQCSGIEVLDRLRIRVRLTRPFAPFPKLLCLVPTSIVPKAVVQPDPRGFGKAPVGTGPFRLETLGPGRTKLTAHPFSWRRGHDGSQLPRLESVVLTAIPEISTRADRFLAGDLDVLSPIFGALAAALGDRAPPQDLVARGIRTLEHTRLGTEYYGFLLGPPGSHRLHPALQDKRVRRALNYAIDRAAIARECRGEQTWCVAGPVPPALRSWEPSSVYEHDPERARGLLREAGYGGDVEFPKIMLTFNSGPPDNEIIAKAVQRQLGEVGVPVKIQELPWSSFISGVDRGDLQFFRLGWICDYPDPADMLALFHSKRHHPDGSNATRYANPKFDALYDEALQITDDKKRSDLYRQAEQMLHDDAPWLFTFHQIQRTLHWERVRELRINIMGELDFSEAWLRVESEK